VYGSHLECALETLLCDVMEAFRASAVVAEPYVMAVIINKMNFAECRLQGDNLQPRPSSGIPPDRDLLFIATHNRELLRCSLGLRPLCFCCCLCNSSEEPAMRWSLDLSLDG
jgi:hypothetical protein